MFDIDLTFNIMSFRKGQLQRKMLLVQEVFNKVIVFIEVIFSIVSRVVFAVICISIWFILHIDIRMIRIYNKSQPCSIDELLFRENMASLCYFRFHYPRFCCSSYCYCTDSLLVYTFKEKLIFLFLKFLSH